MTRKPCFNCGQDDHQLLIQGRTRCKSSGLTYGCPFIINKEIYINRKDVNIQYHTCPNLLVQRYGYNIDDVNKALWEYNREGVGRFIDIVEREKFCKYVQSLCIDKNRSHTFKRQNSIERENHLDKKVSEFNRLL